MKNKYVSTASLLCFLLNFTLLQLILDLPMLYSKVAYNAVWILSIFLFSIILIYQFLVSKMYVRFDGIDIFKISKFAIGKYFDKILYFLFFISFFALTFIYLREIADTIKIIVFDDTRVLIISSLYLIAMVLASYCGFNGIVRACGYIIPLCIVSIIFILFLVFPFIRIERLYPILGSGLKNITLNGIVRINSYIGVGFLFLFVPFIKNIKYINKISYFYTISSFILITFTVIVNTLIFEYPYTSSNLYALYEMAKLTNYNLFFQRTEIIYILALICITFLFLISMFFGANYCLTQIFIKKDKKNKPSIINIILGIILLITANLPNNIFEIFEIKPEVNIYLTIPIIFIIPFVILLIATIKSYINRSEYEKFISNSN